MVLVPLNGVVVQICLESKRGQGNALEKTIRGQRRTSENISSLKQLMDTLHEATHVETNGYSSFFRIGLAEYRPKSLKDKTRS